MSHIGIMGRYITIWVEGGGAWGRGKQPFVADAWHHSAAARAGNTVPTEERSGCQNLIQQILWVASSTKTIPKGTKYGMENF